jgi:hypothetical protein
MIDFEVIRNMFAISGIILWSFYIVKFIDSIIYNVKLRGWKKGLLRCFKI